MPDWIGTFSPEAVIEAIESDLVGASVALGRSDDGVVYRGADVTWVDTGHGALSRVLRARFAAERVEDRVAEVIDCFRHWDAPVRWVVGPTSWPPRLGDALQASGFDAGQTWLGLARDLSLDPSGPPPASGDAGPAACRVARATTERELADWSAVGGHGDDGADAPSARTSALFAPENAGGEHRCRFYLATLDGRPVARCMSHVQGEVVGLHWLDVVPEHRGRGFRSTVARLAMDEARAAGARLAVLVAPATSQALAGRLGFRPYCQFTVHAWPPSLMAHA
jgi:GNAT superfamily N-acetyltransferase